MAQCSQRRPVQDANIPRGETMKTNFVRAVLVSTALLIMTTAATAEKGFEIGGILGGLTEVNIIVKKNTDGTFFIIARPQTSRNGQINLGSLPPGDYEIVIDGKSLVAAMDRVAPPMPARHDSGPSVSLGIGGLFGSGGSHHSSGGAGPTGGESHSGRIGGLAVDPNDPSGNLVNSGGSSTGGVGLGVNVPIGGNHDSSPSGYPMIYINISSSAPERSGLKFSTETPYCRDTAGQGMRIGFTIPERAGGPAAENQNREDLNFSIRF